MADEQLLVAQNKFRKVIMRYNTLLFIKYEHQLCDQAVLDKARRRYERAMASPIADCVCISAADRGNIIRHHHTEVALSIIKIEIK